MQLQIAPSILAADFLELGKDIDALNKNADIIHFDVMDGTFVPNISFGFPVLEAVSRMAKIPMDAHFMVINPEKWVDRCAKAGVSMMSFHLEAAGRKTRSILRDIRSHGMKAGLVINPDVPVEKLYQYIGAADYFLVMSVFAGFGGQKFIYESLDRIYCLKERILSKGNDAKVEVDGGVNEGNIKALADAGVDIAVAGSSVFRSGDPAAAIASLRNAL